MPGRRRLPRSNPGSQDVSAGRIADFLDDVRRSGLELHSLMVVRHGVVVAEGWWDPYRADVVHELYSLSKSFTSTAVGFAAAEGLLSVDDPVLEHLPDAVPDRPHPNLERMRLRHLLTMTTGHQDPTDGAVFPSRDWDRAFLALPVPHEPGTHFLYNTAATYLLSSIVQRRTGERLLDYLRPRLLEPLGIEGATWEQSPSGVDTGGFGLSVTTEDIACFGQLYLDDGVWRGHRVLPEGWVAEATRRHNDSHIDSIDWAQGYGYQFWRCQPPGVYRGDGAFGQFCIVSPEQDAVIAITSGTPDLQGVLDRVWRHLLPALDGPTTGGSGAPTDQSGSAATSTDLARRLADLRLEPPLGTSNAPGLPAGMTIRLAPNPARIAEVELGPAGPDGVPESLTWRAARQVEAVAVGSGQWSLGTMRKRGRAGTLRGRSGASRSPIAAAAAWSEAGDLVLQARPYDTPYCLTITTRFEGTGAGSQVRASASLNVSFGPTDLGTFEGVVA